MIEKTMIGKTGLAVSLLALSLPVYARNLARLSQMTAVNPASLTITAGAADLPRRFRPRAYHSGGRQPGRRWRLALFPLRRHTRQLPLHGAGRPGRTLGC